MKRILTTVVAAACLAGLTAPAGAQGLRITPKVGLYVPLSDLGQAQTTAGLIAADQTGSLAIGVAAELGLPALPFDIRANVDYKTGSEIEADGTVVENVETKMLAVAGDLVFRLPTLILIQPYVFGGAGVRQYDFSGDVTELQDASDPTVHLGGGVDLSLGVLKLNAELGDYISWYEIQEGADAEMQHDFFVTLGLVFGLL
ncbi:MAG: hypothetical protein R3314_03705 [Longimicrobiales bacterium]|nr:hypothetical protein [Longimicrobiales bacterium]